MLAVFSLHVVDVSFGAQGANGFGIGVSLVIKGKGLDVFCIPLAKGLEGLAVELEII